MLSLVLAAAVVTAPALPPPVAAACDENTLRPMLTAPRDKQVANEMELDQRIASTLAEVRRIEKEAADAGERAQTARDMEGKGRLLLFGLALAGLAMGIAAVRRSSLPMLVAAWALVAAGGFLGWRLSARTAELLANQQELTAQQLATVTCRDAIIDTRRELMHSRIATCTHDFSEADEDIYGWITRMKSPEGFQVTLPMLDKLHGEIVQELRY